MEEKNNNSSSELSSAEAFALLLETACKDFENLQVLISGQLEVTAPDKKRKATRTLRAPARIQMALAKSFLFNAHRANRVCEKNKAALALDRTERKLFSSAMKPLAAVRDVNEHGYEGGDSVRPSMHRHEDGTLDETALNIGGPQRIPMGRLNLYDAYLALDRMRKLAGFNALVEKKNEGLSAVDPTVPRGAR